MILLLQVNNNISKTHNHGCHRHQMSEKEKQNQLVKVALINNKNN